MSPSTGSNSRLHIGIILGCGTILGILVVLLSGQVKNTQLKGALTENDVRSRTSFSIVDLQQNNPPMGVIQIARILPGRVFSYDVRSLSGITFRINATNVRLGSGDQTNRLTSDFKFSTRDTTKKAICLSDRATSSGIFLVTCPQSELAAAGVNTSTMEGLPFYLEAEVTGTGNIRANFRQNYPTLTTGIARVAFDNRGFYVSNYYHGNEMHRPLGVIPIAELNVSGHKFDNLAGLSGVTFRVNATNVSLGSGDQTNPLTSDFKLYNPMDPTKKVTCLSDKATSSGNLIITCKELMPSLGQLTNLFPGEKTFVLEAEVISTGSIIPDYYRNNYPSLATAIASLGYDDISNVSSSVSILSSSFLSSSQPPASSSSWPFSQYPSSWPTSWPSSQYSSSSYNSSRWTDVWPSSSSSQPLSSAQCMNDSQCGTASCGTCFLNGSSCQRNCTVPVCTSGMCATTSSAASCPASVCGTISSWSSSQQTPNLCGNGRVDYSEDCDIALPGEEECSSECTFDYPPEDLEIQIMALRDNGSLEEVSDLVDPGQRLKVRISARNAKQCLMQMGGIGGYEESDSSSDLYSEMSKEFDYTVSEDEYVGFALHCSNSQGVAVATSALRVKINPYAIAKLIETSTEDRVGTWNKFNGGFGNTNQNSKDWKIELLLNVPHRTRAIKNINFYHNFGGEFWSTNNSQAYPIGIFLPGNMPNAADLLLKQEYTDSLALYHALPRLDPVLFYLYMQPEHPNFLGGILRIEFTDGFVKEVTVPGIPPRCGDGRVNQPSEQCDGSSACSSICLNLPRCGDNIVNQVSEECDGGGASCSATCSLTAVPTATVTVNSNANPPSVIMLAPTTPINLSFLGSNTARRCSWQFGPLTAPGIWNKLSPTGPTKTFSKTFTPVPTMPAVETVLNFACANSGSLVTRSVLFRPGDAAVPPITVSFNGSSIYPIGSVQNRPRNVLHRITWNAPTATSCTVSGLFPAPNLTFNGTIGVLPFTLTDTVQKNVTLTCSNSLGSNSYTLKVKGT